MTSNNRMFEDSTRQAAELIMNADYPVTSFVANFTRAQWEAMGNTWMPDHPELTLDVADDEVITFYSDQVVMVKGAMALACAPEGFIPWRHVVVDRGLTFPKKGE